MLLGTKENRRGQIPESRRELPLYKATIEMNGYALKINIYSIHHRGSLEIPLTGSLDLALINSVSFINLISTEYSIRTVKIIAYFILHCQIFKLNMFACCQGPPPIEENGKPNSSNDEQADELMSAPTLTMINNTINESTMVKNADPSAVDDLLDGVAKSVQSGTISVTSSLKAGAESAAYSFEDMQNFLSSLFTTPSKTVHVPSPANSSSTLQTEETDSTKAGGIKHVEYKKYALKGYVEIPEVLKPFMDALKLDHYVICSLPTMAPSVGLAGHRDTVPKAVRAAAPFLIVVDEPGKLAGYEDNKYVWVELKMGDVFRLDISKMKKIEDYVATLSKKAKWNFKDRQKKFNNPKLISSEVVPIKQGDKAFLDTIWPLYKQTVSVELEKYIPAPPCFL